LDPLLPDPHAVDDTVIAVAMATLLFILPSGAPGTRLLGDDWTKRVPWGVLVLLGSGFALAAAVESSGLAAWLANRLGRLGDMPPLLLVLAITTLLVVLTEFTVNSAITALMMPVLAASAVGLHVDPRLLMIPATLGASFGFMMPGGTAPNAMVFASGHLTVAQMVRAGIGIDLLGILVITVVFYVIGIPVFGIGRTGRRRGRIDPCVHRGRARARGGDEPPRVLARDAALGRRRPPDRDAARRPAADVHARRRDPARAGASTRAPSRPAGPRRRRGRVHLHAPRGRRWRRHRDGHPAAGEALHPMPAQLLLRSRDADGSPRDAHPSRGRARAGEPSTLTLMLTTPPATPSVETVIDAVMVPEHARLELAYGLSPAAGIPGAAPVLLEVAAEPEGGAVVSLWNATIQGERADGPRWNEVSVPLDAVAGKNARFHFRARTVGDGRPALVPLWADPTIVAPVQPKAARRNVILISIDTLRADRLAAYGAYRRAMPQIDAFARDAVVFTDAWSVWPETSGSHMSLFTSLYPSQHGVKGFIASPPPVVTLT
jgi:hypothetical protein